MTFLVDTNVVSELRRRRPDPGVVAWSREATAAGEPVFTSVLVLGELRRGVERLRRRDARAADALEAWVIDAVRSFGDRVLPVTTAIADRWGRNDVPDRLPIVDGLLAATALEHGLTLVTRNVADVERTRVRVLNPFSG